MLAVVTSSYLCCFFFFKQKTAYEMRISDWSSDVCSSDLAIFSGMALVLSRIPLETFARFAFPAYGVVLTALFLVELIGGVAGGSQRWINLGFIDRKSTRLNSSH